MSRADVLGVQDAILHHLVKYPHSILSAYDLGRVLGISPNTARRTCEALYGEAKIWRVDGKDRVTRYQASPSYLRKLDD